MAGRLSEIMKSRYLRIPPGRLWIFLKLACAQTCVSCKPLNWSRELISLLTGRLFGTIIPQRGLQFQGPAPHSVSQGKKSGLHYWGVPNSGTCTCFAWSGMQCQMYSCKTGRLNVQMDNKQQGHQQNGGDLTVCSLRINRLRFQDVGRVTHGLRRT